MSGELRVLNIAALTAGQRAALRDLHVSARQAFHGKSFAESLMDWDGESRDLALGASFWHAAGQPVGLVLFKRCKVATDTASMHGLKIATPWQGQGWGHSAMRAGVTFLRTEWPRSSKLVLSVNADNHAAIAVYRRYGMVDHGLVHAGKHGPELHMMMPV